MALARALGVALTGLDGRLVEVECDISPGLPGLAFTGGADASIQDSRDRLRAAVTNSGAEWPNRKVTIALLPADLRKTGSRFDLAVVLALLAATGQVPASAIAATVWIAELGLDGRLRPVRGVLPAVLAAADAGARRVVVSEQNAEEASLVTGLDVRTASHLRDVIAAMTGDGPALATASAGPPPPSDTVEPDLADVAGQSTAKRALEIAAAGGHHLYLVGTPGSGKTMMARRLPGLLPRLEDTDALQVTAVHSVVGALGDPARLIHTPPLQAPHHTASVAALVGGGSGIARPGAISLAHGGVLFLDEAPEFSPRALDALRQPLETGRVVLHRGGGSVTYPSRFQLLMAGNPCACARRAKDCTCPAQVKRRHLQRLSGPLLDRVDLRVHVEPLAHADLFEPVEARESSAVVAQRVQEGRHRAAARWASTPYRTNAEVPGSLLRSPRWLPPRRVTAEVEGYLERGVLSARGFDRVLRLAWTVADLNDHPAPTAADMAEALFYRAGSEQSWAA